MSRVSPRWFAPLLAALAVFTLYGCKGGDGGSNGGPGTLDRSFGGKGWIIHNNAAGGAGNDVGNTITTDASGRILVAGYSVGPNGFPDMVIWRYNDDGRLDGTFNGQGWVVHDNAAGGGGWDVAYGMTIDASGRIVAAGFSANPNDADMAIWRYIADGSLDTTFGGQGWVIHDNAAAGLGGDYGNGITLDASGRILVAGSSWNPSANADMVIWRYDPNGLLDTTFNGIGWVVHDGAAGGNTSDWAQDVALDGSGRIVAAGGSFQSGGNLDMALWRYIDDGSLDTSFNGQGWAVHDNAAGGSGGDEAHDLVIDSSGRILVIGQSTAFGGIPDLALWRYDGNGSLDTTFNGQGWTTHDSAAGGSGWDIGFGITLDSTGRIVATGLSERAVSDPDMVIWRYETDGTLDRGFRRRGWVTHDSAAGAWGDGGYAITLDAAERILVTGYSQNPASDSDMVIWRYK